MATAVWRMLMDCDVRALLGDLAVPVLVVHARDNAYIRVGHGRYLTEHIPGARYVELATADHVPWVCAADIAGEVEEFLTGTRHTPASHRPLAAVLFTDIVGSTEQAALLGDRAWYMPAWLGQGLPKVNVEGEPDPDVDYAAPPRRVAQTG